MITVIQRVSKAEVKVDHTAVGKIDLGLLILVGIENKENEEENAKKLAEKILKLRIFSDVNDKMNLSVIDIKGEILVISQFTLMANTTEGNRPFFGNAAPPEIAEPIFNLFIEELKKSGLKVETGKFGAKMQIELTNDGPVTIIL